MRVEVGIDLAYRAGAVVGADAREGGLANCFTSSAYLVLALARVVTSWSTIGLPRRRSRVHKPSASGMPTFDWLERTMTPRFRSRQRQTNTPKPKVPPLCQTTSP